MAKTSKKTAEAQQAEAPKTETRPATYHLLNDFGLYKNSLRRKLDMDELEYYHNRDGKNPEVALLPALLHQHKGFEYVLSDVELLAKYLVYSWEDDLVLKNGILPSGDKAPNIRKHFAKLCFKDYERVQGIIAKFKKDPRPDVTVEIKPEKAKKAPKPKAPAKPKFEIPKAVQEAAMQYADANSQWKSRRFGKLVRAIKEAGFEDYQAVLDYMSIIPPAEAPVKADPTKISDVINLTEIRF